MMSSQELPESGQRGLSITPQTREHRHRDGHVRRHPDRDPEEARRGDPDDGEGLPFDPKRAADRGTIPCEAPLPGGIAQHRHGLRLGRGIPDVSLIEKAACCRLKAEGVVKRAGHERHRRRLRFARPLGLQGPRRPREHAPEHVRPIAHLLEHGVGETRILQRDQLVRRGHGQRPQQDRVNQREDRGHPANPAGERQHGGERQPGCAAELPQRKPQVAPHLIQWTGHRASLKGCDRGDRRVAWGKGRTLARRPFSAPRIVRRGPWRQSNRPVANTAVPRTSRCDRPDLPAEAGSHTFQDNIPRLKTHGSRGFRLSGGRSDDPLSASRRSPPARDPSPHRPRHA